MAALCGSEMRGFLAVLVVGLSGIYSACGPRNEQQRPIRLTAEQCRVIQDAERYVREYGYSSDPPTASEAELVRDSAKGELPVKEAVKLRRNSLRPFAIGLVHGVAGQGGGTVIFEPNPEWLRQFPDPEHRSDGPATGAAIFVPSTGPIYVSGRDFVLDHIEVRLPSHELVVKGCNAER